MRLGCDLKLARFSITRQFCACRPGETSGYLPTRRLGRVFRGPALNAPGETGGTFGDPPVLRLGCDPEKLGFSVTQLFSMLLGCRHDCRSDAPWKGGFFGDPPFFDAPGEKPGFQKT
jgi:hypothetical protein